MAPLGHKKNPEQQVLFGIFLAESEGFEPPVPRGTTVFKTAAFDHSANSPWSATHQICGAKVEYFLIPANYFLCRIHLFRNLQKG